MKSDLKNGSLLEIPLEGNIAYTYCQVHFFKEIVITLFDFWKDESVKGKKKFDFTRITGSSLLTEPKVLMRLPPLRGAKKWNYIGEALPILEQPIDFRIGGKDNDIVSILPNGDSSSRSEQYLNKDVEHLPIWGHIDPTLLRTILTLVFYKKNKMDEEQCREKSFYISNNAIFNMANNLAESIISVKYWEGIGADPNNLKLKAKGDPVG